MDYQEKRSNQFQLVTKPLDSTGEEWIAHFCGYTWTRNCNRICTFTTTLRSSEVFGLNFFN